MRFRALLVLLGALALAVVVGWMSGAHPLFEAVTNVRAQFFPIAIVLVAGFGALRKWYWAAAAGVLLMFSLSYVMPYWTATADARPGDGDTARVMQYNVFFGNEDSQAIADHITDADADVVVLHEVTPDQWRDLQPLLEDYPYAIAEPLAESQGQLSGGMAMLSREPLHRLPIDEQYSPSDRVIIAADTFIEGTEVTVVGLHPFASRNDSRKAVLRETQLAGLADLARSTSLPMVIVADLNITPTSPQYHQFIDDLGWRDPHRIVGWQSTWPTWGGPFGMPIDHVFVSNDVALHDYEPGDGAGSDHLSLVAEISFTDNSDDAPE